MPNTVKNRLETMLFDYGTTNKTDFRGGDIKEPIITTYKAKPTIVRQRPPPLKDTHTLSVWKVGTVPFNVFHRPKDIVGTNPSELPRPYVKPKDTALEEVQRTRPRLVITPAVSMDDIEDPNARAILCNSIYTTEVMQSQRESIRPYLSNKAPLPSRPAVARPIVLPKLQPPYVSPEWRMESASWDRNQLRAHCEPTRDFWLRHQGSRCRPCDELATITAHRKIMRR